MMVENWRECKLDSICSRITSGGTPYTHNIEYYNGDIPWLNTKEIKNCRIYHTEKYITKLGLDSSSAKWIYKNSVIVAMYGATAGKVAINKIPLTTNQACCNLTIDDTKADYNFIYYLLLNNFDILDNMTSGAAQQNLNVGLISNLNISLPPLQEQKAIAEILSSLDDKIDLLHRQNHTLESIAQTLFRQWFETREQESTIADIVMLQSGYAFKSKDFQQTGSERVLKIKNISNSIIDISNTDFIDPIVTNSIDNKFKISSGDILFGMTGAEIGKMGIVPQNNKNLWLNQRVGVLREKYIGARYLAYLQLITEFGNDYITNTASGSAQPNISATEIEQCPFPRLTDKEIENYSNKVSHFFDKIIFNLGQIQTLENLRDTLLPKLISGEVRVGT